MADTRVSSALIIQKLKTKDSFIKKVIDDSESDNRKRSNRVNDANRISNRQ